LLPYISSTANSSNCGRYCQGLCCKASPQLTLLPAAGQPTAGQLAFAGSHLLAPCESSLAGGSVGQRILAAPPPGQEVHCQRVAMAVAHCPCQGAIKQCSASPYCQKHASKHLAWCSTFMCHCCVVLRCDTVCCAVQGVSRRLSRCTSGSGLSTGRARGTSVQRS
jgi:hypothetical protein